MIGLFNHQKRIGIVGTSPDAENFIFRANKLGFYTYQLSQEKKDSRWSSNADEIFFGSLADPLIQEEFIMKSDILVYFDYSIDSDQLEEANKAIFIPQGEDLLAITKDRVLQKAFKESLSVNIAPFETIVKKEDIVNAIPSIGYPAVLRTNFAKPVGEIDEYFIYDETDIEEASKLLKYGTCVLESWIISEHQLSITVVKSASGYTQLYPIIKKNYRGERLSSIEKFRTEDNELKDEVRRVTKLIADNISFVGALTVDFIISPAHALYIGDIHGYPNSLTRYSEGYSANSIIEAHLRAVTSLPVAEIDDHQKDFIYIPIYADQAEIMNELITIYPDWQFNFYSLVKDEKLDTSKEIGYIIVETEDFKQTSELLKKYTI